MTYTFSDAGQVLSCEDILKDDCFDLEVSNGGIKNVLTTKQFIWFIFVPSSPSLPDPCLPPSVSWWHFFPAVTSHQVRRWSWVALTHMQHTTGDNNINRGVESRNKLENKIPVLFRYYCRMTEMFKTHQKHTHLLIVNSPALWFSRLYTKGPGWVDSGGGDSDISVHTYSPTRYSENVWLTVCVWKA